MKVKCCANSKWSHGTRTLLPVDRGDFSLFLLVPPSLPSLDTIHLNTTVSKTTAWHGVSSRLHLLSPWRIFHLARRSWLDRSNGRFSHGHHEVEVDPPYPQYFGWGNWYKNRGKALVSRSYASTASLTTVLRNWNCQAVITPLYLISSLVLVSNSLRLISRLTWRKFLLLPLKCRSRDNGAAVTVAFTDTKFLDMVAWSWRRKFRGPFVTLYNLKDNLCIFLLRTKWEESILPTVDISPHIVLYGFTFWVVLPFAQWIDNTYVHDYRYSNDYRHSREATDVIREWAFAIHLGNATVPLNSFSTLPHHA